MIQATNEDLQQETEANESGLNYEAVKFAISFPESSDAIAVIYVRSYCELDSNVLAWESSGWLNGDCLYHEADMLDRKQAIGDAARAIAASLGKSRRKADKIAAEAVAEFLKTVEECDESELPGEPSNWFDSNDADAGAEPEATRSDESPAEGEQAEESEQVTEEATESPQGEQTEQPTAEQRKQLADEKNEQFETEFRTRMARLGEQLVAAVLHRVACDDRLKSAKAAEKELIEEIQKSAERGPEKMPLFDGKKSPANESQHPQGEAAASESAEASPPTDSDAWRSRPVSELGLPEKLVERLADNGIETIGRLEDQRASFDGLRGIKGIGEAKADAIEAAVLAWLDKNRDSQVLAEAAGKPAEETQTEAEQGEADAEGEEGADEGESDEQEGEGEGDGLI